MSLTTHYSLLDILSIPEYLRSSPVVPHYSLLTVGYTEYPGILEIIPSCTSLLTVGYACIYKCMGDPAQHVGLLPARERNQLSLQQTLCHNTRHSHCLPVSSSTHSFSSLSPSLPLSLASRHAQTSSPQASCLALTPLTCQYACIHLERIFLYCLCVLDPVSSVSVYNAMCLLHQLASWAEVNTNTL